MQTTISSKLLDWSNQESSKPGYDAVSPRGTQDSSEPSRLNLKLKSASRFPPEPFA